MIQLDFNSLLNITDKAGIMAMVEKEVDRVIAEQERYTIAKANVASDNYSIDDLIILEARIADTKVEEAKSIRADFIEAGKKPAIMTSEEFVKFFEASSWR